nr:glycosyltransferase family A protein [uncultured Holophaga sp.]
MTRPLVSLCTPTRDRLAFLALLRRCIEVQDFPAEHLEWVVVDDGGVPAEGVLRGHPGLRYLRVEPQPLGAKRNACHRAASGEILINLDDDDYYPPSRVRHALEALASHPECPVAGCSELPLCFLEPEPRVWRLGPYGPGHATAATLAFRRGLLDLTACDDGAERGEEAGFLKGFALPMVQLDPGRTILAMAHGANTYDKSALRLEPARFRARLTEERLEDWIRDPELRMGYLAAAQI